MTIMPKVRGKESITLTFVWIAFLSITYIFLTKGTATDMAGYGTAVGIILAIWLGREWTEKVSRKNGQGTSNLPE